MKESGWKKWTGSRTGKNLTGREMDWKNKAEGWDWIGLEKKEQRKKMKENGHSGRSGAGQIFCSGPGSGPVTAPTLALILFLGAAQSV